MSVVGCGGGGGPHSVADMTPTCDDSFFGDPTQPPAAVLVVTDGSSGTLVDVMAGDAVPLERPPQGGQVPYAAARVRNMNRCNVTVQGRFRDPTTMDELGFDKRSTDLVVGADGWGRPDVTEIANLANIPLCPDNDPVRDNVGQPAILEMVITDMDGHSVTLSPTVTPTCGSTDPAMQALCECECTHLPSTGRMCSSSAADLGAP